MYLLIILIIIIKMHQKQTETAYNLQIIRLNMPVDEPTKPNESDVELSELENGDEITVEFESSDGSIDEFTAEVTRTTKFDGGTEVRMTKNTRIYGDFYPPIVRTPNGDELRLRKINRV